MEKMTLHYPDWTRVQEVELVYKTKVKAAERSLIKSSKDSYNTLMTIWDENRIELQEEFKVLLLNRAHRVIGVYDSSMGGICGTVVDVRLILATAIKSLATAIVLAHNHPSCNLKPSEPDIQITRKIKAAAMYHDIDVLDHIIVSTDGYYSFSDEGVL